MTRSGSVPFSGVPGWHVGFNTGAIACFVIGVLLVIHAAFRGVSADLDASAYSDWYLAVAHMDWQEFVSAASHGIYFEGVDPWRFEIGFALLAFLCASIGLGVGGFFGMCAALSLAPKIIAFIRYSSAPVATLVWYISVYYLVLEMNAIRAGLAVGILMLGIRHLVSPRLTRFLPYVLVASLFHVSAITGLLLYWMSLRRPGVPLMASLVIASMVFSFLPVVQIVAPVGAVVPKVDEYLALLRGGEAFAEVNQFNVIVLARLTLLVALLFALTRTVWGPPERIGLYALVLSLAIYFALASFPVVAGRLSEVIAVFQVFVVSALFRVYVPRLIPRLGFTLFVVAQFWAVTFHARLVDFFYFTNIDWLRVDLVMPR